MKVKRLTLWEDRNSQQYDFDCGTYQPRRKYGDKIKVKKHEAQRVFSNDQDLSYWSFVVTLADGTVLSGYVKEHEYKAGWLVLKILD